MKSCIETHVSSCLLPNEEMIHHFEIDAGYSIFTNRRLVIAHRRKSNHFKIVKTIPYDCIQDIRIHKENVAIVNAFSLDRNGNLTRETMNEFLKAPRTKKGDDKKETSEEFQSSVENVLNVLNKLGEHSDFRNSPPPMRDYTYLSDLPEYLTRNAL
ncbi:MAG: hypothetical protein ACW98Y_18575, partial [Candidatus Thorarchaeota archaeon]